MKYDVIIAGASFAGLAVAAQLSGKRVLLLDRKPIGTGQTSACGTLVSTLQALDLQASIRQVHEQLILHTPGRTFVYPVADEPFCTFDYQRLCQILRARSDAVFIRSPALAAEGHEVQTPQGVFHGDVIVDATGWRAALGNRYQPSLIRPDRLNFGMETTLAYQDDGLHFWYNPARLLPQGITWAFPAGSQTRIGIASYMGATRLKDDLERFLSDLGLQRGRVHGGYFPHALRASAVNGVFLVGDAAGQCLGLTGEGIRPALFFGYHLGRLLRLVLAGAITLNRARQTYETLVSNRRRGYELLCLAQRVLPRLPLPLLQQIMAMVARDAVLDRIMRVYVRTFRLDTHPAILV